jgi:hypothetical protein
MTYATACRTAEQPGGPTSLPNVELLVEALLPGDFLFALAFGVVLSGILALGAKAEAYRMTLCWLRNLQ